MFWFVFLESFPKTKKSIAATFENDVEEWTSSLLTGDTLTGKSWIVLIFIPLHVRFWCKTDKNMICLGKFWILFISFTNLGALCLYFYDTSPSGNILYHWLSYHLFTNVKITIPSKNEVFTVVVFCYLNSFSWALWGLSTFWWQLQSAGFSSRNSLTWLTKTFQIKLSRLKNFSD